MKKADKVFLEICDKITEKIVILLKSAVFLFRKGNLLLKK